MKNKFFALVIAAYASYQDKNAEAANKSIRAAFEAEDAGEAVSAMEDALKSEDSMKTTSGDNGVVFNTPGSGCRVEPESKVSSSVPPGETTGDDDEEPDSSVKSEVKPAVTARVARKQAYFASML